LNKSDFFWYLSDIYTTGVQYGDRINLCNTLLAVKDSEIITQLEAVAGYGNHKGLSYY